ncbi:MAG TPA: hypothetical protein VL025_20150 [Thermoanaerobaculia bacterium]|nr:hypothetical protein [Thermoanaerobaculia bacterium]
MKRSFRRVLAGSALAAVLVSGFPSRGEADPARDRAPSLRSVPSSWSRLAAVGEAWNELWGWVVQASGGGRHPGDGNGSSGNTPVPPKGDQGSGIDPDGKP